MITDVIKVCEISGWSLEQCQDNSIDRIVQLFCSFSRLLCLAVNHIFLCPVDLTGFIFMYCMDTMSVGINLLFINSIAYCTATSVASSQWAYSLVQWFLFQSLPYTTPTCFSKCTGAGTYVAGVRLLCSAVDIPSFNI